MACILYNPYAVCEPSDIEKIYYWDNENNIRLTKTMIAFAFTHILILLALTFRINYLAKQVNELKKVVYEMHNESHDESRGVEELRAIEE